MSSRPKDRTSMLLGFLVASGVALVLASVIFISWQVVKLRSQLQVSIAVVSTVAAAIETYPVKTWSWPVSASSRRTEFMWDLNHDGLVDGVPALVASATTDGGFPPEVIAAGYTGFYAMVKPTISLRFLSRRHQPIDAWGKPLRIAFAAGVYGSMWFGIWSAGTDGIDGTADDVKSWR